MTLLLLVLLKIEKKSSLQRFLPFDTLSTGYSKQAGG